MLDDVGGSVGGCVGGRVGVGGGGDLRRCDGRLYNNLRRGVGMARSNERGLRSHGMNIGAKLE